MLRQFWSLTFDLNIITESSANKSVSNFVSFGRTKGSERVFLERESYVIDK